FRSHIAANRTTCTTAEATIAISHHRPRRGIGKVGRSFSFAAFGAALDATCSEGREGTTGKGSLALSLISRRAPPGKALMTALGLSSRGFFAFRDAMGFPELRGFARRQQGDHLFEAFELGMAHGERRVVPGIFMRVGEGLRLRPVFEIHARVPGGVARIER